MANHRNRFPARRRFLKQSTALTASMVALPHLARAKPEEPAPVQPTGTTRGTKQDATANAPQPPLRHAAPRRPREPKP